MASELAGADLQGNGKVSHFILQSCQVSVLPLCRSICLGTSAHQECLKHFLKVNDMLCTYLAIMLYTMTEAVCIVSALDCDLMNNEPQRF